MTFKFLGFAGSLRKNSYNRAALRAAQGLTPPEAALEAVSLALGHASVSFTEAQYARFLTTGFFKGELAAFNR